MLDVLSRLGSQRVLPGRDRGTIRNPIPVYPEMFYGRGDFVGMLHRGGRKIKGFIANFPVFENPGNSGKVDDNGIFKSQGMVKDCDGRPEVFDCGGLLISTPRYLSKLETLLRQTEPQTRFNNTGIIKRSFFP